MSAHELPRLDYASPAKTATPPTAPRSFRPSKPSAGDDRAVRLVKWLMFIAAIVWLLLAISERNR